MKILLLGAGGRLGRELSRALAPLGSIIGCVRPGGSAAASASARPLDVTRRDDLRALVRDARPEVIVNAAAYTAVEAAEREPELALAINAAVPGVLAEEAARLGAALVHYSTDYVFSGAGTRPWREDDPTQPLNVYGRSKLAGETAIRSSRAAHLIVRTSWLYAAQGPSFVTRMLDLAREQEVIAMVSDQVGAPTSARFVADATAGILSQGQATIVPFLGEHGGPLHVVCSGETSWHGYAAEIFAEAARQQLPLPMPQLKSVLSADRPGALPRPLNSRLDTTRLREHFGIVAPDWRAEFRRHAAELFRCYLAEAGPIHPAG
jgi:dTDP-4-dehydrorhamnose reductase